MSLKKDVLEMLTNHSGYISGEELASHFGKSRAAVWKAVKSLQKEGYKIDAVTNRGYSLSGENNIINADEISRYMKNKIKVLYYPKTDSTNTQAKRLIAQGDNSVMLVVASEQTAGRGRQGKSFYSPNTGIYLSLVIHPDTSLQNAVTATTAAAVAVSRAIERLSDLRPEIKWVNDVFVNGKKACGILTEAVSDFETGIVSSVIIGIGVNITTSDFPDTVENGGCLGIDISRAKLVAAIADEMLEIAFSDYSQFIEYYRTHSNILGKKINYIENGVSTPATAVAIDEKGGLTVEKENGERLTLRSGEISIRSV